MEIVFKGKEAVYNYHLTVPFRPLVPNATKSVGEPILDGNLIIHGDNLHALKALLPRYAGRVDCIFIDPPYNTGYEGWVYNDAVNSPPAKEWLGSVVGNDDLLRHDKWCCMIWPRLRLLHELLAEEGTFWMTLDDNEVAHARMMLDEIFGEQNFLANVVWQKKYATANDAADFSAMHDHILVYCKSRGQGANNKVSAVLSRLERTDSQDKLYKNPDEDPKGSWMSDNYTCNKTSEERPNLFYPIIHPVSHQEIWPETTRVWAFSKDRHERNVREGRIWWGKDGENLTPRYKRYLSEVRDSVSTTWWDYSFAGHNEEAKRLLQNIFDDRDQTFPTPKPLKLLELVVALATSEESIVLDSFAGSATTGHAVLAANARDEGHRRFILVESESYADVETGERMRRVIKGYKFKGALRSELFRERLTWKQSTKVLGDAAYIISKAESKFDKIETKFEDGQIVVTGVKQVGEQTEGLGGTFTFCALGEALDLDKMLVGEGLPGWTEVSGWLYHTATGGTLIPKQAVSKEPLEEWYVGESDTHHIWTIYRPDASFLQSPEAALSLDIAKRISRLRNGKPHLVFAPFRFASSNQLRPFNVEYAALPFSLNRLERE